MRQLLEEQLRLMTNLPQQTGHGMAVLPLIRSLGACREYISLRQALDADLIDIKEVSHGGNVPNLRVSNRADKPVLLLDGEELRGAKQNRVLNTSILIAANESLNVPVSCVESGRWSYRSQKFQESGNMMPSSLRSSKSMQVSNNLAVSGEARADQARVWHEIDLLMREKRSPSPTNAMDDVYVSRGRNLDEICVSFPLLEGQCGICVAFGGEVAGIDLVSRPEVWRDLHPKLIRSYAMDLLDRDYPTREAPLGMLDNVVSLILSGHLDAYPGVGLGDDVRLANQNLIGSVLVWEGEIVHLGAYPRHLNLNRERPEFYASPRQRGRV